MITPTDYHRLRVSWCLHALRALLRRWGVYVVLAAGLLGAGTTGGLANFGAAAAWLVLPLWHEVAQSAGRAVLATALQAVAGAAVIWALRPLLLPRAWLEAERALPLARATRLRSDAWLCGAALAPLALLYTLGAVPVLVSDPDWLRPHRATAVGALLLATAGALALGVATLQLRRRPPRTRRPQAPPAVAARPGGWPRRGWPVALLALPLVRGPARRCGSTLAAGAALACVPALGLWWLPRHGPWWLAGLALVGLVTCTRVGALVREEVVPLLALATSLPLPQRRLRLAAAGLPMLAWLPAMALLVVQAPALARSGPRPAVLAAYAGLALLTGLIEGHERPADAATYGARWIFLLALLLALASSVWK